MKERVKRYPVLRNEVGDAHQAWSVKVDNELKLMCTRNRQLSCAQMLHYHRSGRVLNSPLTCLRQKVEKLHFSQHSKTMTNSSSSSKCWSKKQERSNQEKITHLMAETYPEWKNQTIQGIHAKLQDQYPALFTPEDISNEYKILVENDLDDNFLQVFSPMASRLVMHTKSKKKKTVKVEAILDKHFE